MPIETIKFEGESYPLYETSGFASQFAFPFAKQVLTGAIIYDIGYNREEWKFPGAIGIDLNSNDERLQDATNLPDLMIDGIFASHVLEHIPEWVKTLEHWKSRLKSGGVLFLYLPHYSQRYWRAWRNLKHCNVFTPEIIKDYLTDNGYKNVFVSERDLYHSFMAMAEKI